MAAQRTRPRAARAPCRSRCVPLDRARSPPRIVGLEGVRRTAAPALRARTLAPKRKTLAPKKKPPPPRGGGGGGGGGLLPANVSGIPHLTPTLSAPGGGEGEFHGGEQRQRSAGDGALAGNAIGGACRRGLCELEPNLEAPPARLSTQRTRP